MPGNGDCILRDVKTEREKPISEPRAIASAWDGIV